MPELTREEIEIWVKETHGWFSNEWMRREREVESLKAKETLRKTLRRFCEGEKPILRHHPTKHGIYQLVEGKREKLLWKEANIDNVVDLRWPFGLEEYVLTLPRNVMVIAGEPNAGKTAFCHNFIANNMNRSELGRLLPIQTLNTEAGMEEVKRRRMKFDIPIDDWSDDVWEVRGDLADALEPDKINVIDFLKITKDFFLIADILESFYARLTTGVCLVAIQKDPRKPPPPGSKGPQPAHNLGRGGSLGLETPRLYLTMSQNPNKLKIEKGKIWANELVNPNNKAFSFNLIQGWKFTNIQEIGAPGEWRE